MSIYEGMEERNHPSLIPTVMISIYLLRTRIKKPPFSYTVIVSVYLDEDPESLRDKRSGKMGLGFLTYRKNSAQTREGLI